MTLWIRLLHAPSFGLRKREASGERRAQQGGQRARFSRDARPLEMLRPTDLENSFEAV